MINADERKRGTLTVGVVADLPEGAGGGVNEFTRCLVRTLCNDSPRGLRLVIFVNEHDPLDIATSQAITTVKVQASHHPAGWKRWPERVRRYGRAARAMLKGNTMGARVAVARGRRQQVLTEALSRSPWLLDVLHFPFQDYVSTTIPTIFSPWDLQHRHFPHLWSGSAVADRDAYYKTACDAAARVVFGSEWAREDLIRQYGMNRSKTRVVPVAAPSSLTPPAADQMCEHVSDKYHLPRSFVYYPAAPWKHKNHSTLITGLAHIRQTTNLDLHLVCSGPTREDLVADILNHASDVGFADHVHFLGYLESKEVRALYRLALMCVYPSLFEGAGLPVLEAFTDGCPLVASNVTCIPEYAGDAARYCDPTDWRSIEDAIQEVASKPNLRDDLRQKGRIRAAKYSWERVADSYLTMYQEVASTNAHGILPAV